MEADNELLENAVRALYRTFHRYRIDNSFEGCSCCVSQTQSDQLIKKGLHSLSADDLRHYAMKAMTTWGTVRDFKYFLPRVLELVVYDSDEFELEILFGKLKYAHMQAWDSDERLAVENFLLAYWRSELVKPPIGSHDMKIANVLSGLAAARESVAPYLDVWAARMHNQNAISHLVAYILNVDIHSLAKGRPSRAFIGLRGVAADEVLHWLQSDSVEHAINGCKSEPREELSVRMNVIRDFQFD